MKEQLNKNHFCLRKVKDLICAETLIILFAISFSIGHSDAVSVAVSFSGNPNVTAFSKFDWVVVDPDSEFEPSKVESSAGNTIWFSYVYVSEVKPYHSYYEEVPADWLIDNDMEVFCINQTAPGWPSFFMDKVITPLWNRGFKGFFLDELDLYGFLLSNNDDVQAQEKGIAQLIRTIKTKYPSALLILHEGFKILSSVHQDVNMVAFESLITYFDLERRKFIPTDQNGRDLLLSEVRDIKEKLPILAIDFCPPDNSTCVQNTVKLIKEQGFVPYITDPLYQTVGFGPNEK